MIIMPSNNTGKVVRDLFAEYPEKMASLNTPQSFKTPIGKWALDNGCFSKFDKKGYFKALNSIQQRGFGHPLFVVVPDVVGCHCRTLDLWGVYYPILYKYGYPLAFVAQDGCEPDLVPKEADWIFIGGKDPWKMENIHKYVGLGKPVHVGRVNSIGRLRYCEDLGVTSIDGTGWMLARDKQFYDLMEYFNGEKQCLLF